MFIIRFLLIILLIGVVIGGLTITFIYRKIHQDANQFKQQTGEHTRSDKQTVEDRRNPSEANKKIIPKDEGEYVDFEEEK